MITNQKYCIKGQKLNYNNKIITIKSIRLNFFFIKKRIHITNKLYKKNKKRKLNERN